MVKKAEKNKIATAFIYIILIFAILVLIFSAKSMFFSKEKDVSRESVATDHFGAGGFTEYDLILAKKLMDKDGDGKCDVCGMPVEMCIDSGQLQCDMDSKSTIRVLGSAHIHAYFKVYVNGKEINFAQEKYFVKSRFIHIENEPQGDSGEVLHMHATGVPLWIFFESIDLELPSEMKAYVNGKETSDYKDYVFEDSDEILITDGRGDLQKQLDSVTDFAKDY